MVQDKLEDAGNDDKIGIDDEPLLRGDEDQLGITPHARALTKFVRKTATPITIGIQGEWGSGKTSLLQQIEHLLEADPPTPLQITVNAWEHSLLRDPEQALVKIIQEIIVAINEKTVKSGNKRRRVPFLNATNPDKTKDTTEILKNFARLGVALKGGSGATKALDAFFDPKEKTNSIKRLRELLRESSKSVRESKDNSYDRIVVYVDDLDRIEPRVAVRLLELLKNIFNVPGCVFVLAIDYDVVVVGLEEKFGKPDEKNEHKFRAFFDKIIQLPFQMPTERSLVKYINHLLDRIGFKKEGERLKDKLIEDSLKYTIGANPRSIKRLINSLALIQLLSAELSEEEEPLEPELLFILTCIQTAYPDIYRLLLRAPVFWEWTERFSLENSRAIDNEKSVEQEKSIQEARDREFAGEKKAECEREVWQDALFRICYVQPRYRYRFPEICKLLQMVRESAGEEDRGETVRRMIERTAVTSVYDGNDSVPTDESSWKSKEQQDQSKALWKKILDELKGNGIDHMGVALASDRKELSRWPKLNAYPSAKLHLQHTEPRIGLVMPRDQAGSLYDQLEKTKDKIEEKVGKKGASKLTWEWDPNPDQKKIRISFTATELKEKVKLKRTDKTPLEDDWAAIAKFFSEWTPIFEDVMGKVLMEIQSLNKTQSE